MRLGSEPLGGARVAYGVLALVLAGLAAGIVTAVVVPLALGGGACRADDSGFCGLLLGSLVWLVATWVMLAVTAYALRLGWWFWAVAVLASAVGLQLGVETISLWPVVLTVVIALAGAWFTDPGGSGEMPRWRRWVVAGLVVVGVGQLVVWAWLLLSS